MCEINEKSVECPARYCSRVLTTHECNYLPTEGEALAISVALKCFAHMLYGFRVLIQTDNKPL